MRDGNGRKARWQDSGGSRVGVASEDDTTTCGLRFSASLRRVRLETEAGYFWRVTLTPLFQDASGALITDKGARQGIGYARSARQAFHDAWGTLRYWNR